MSLNKALVAPHRSHAGRPQPPCSYTVQPWLASDGFASSFPGRQLGRFNSFKGTQLPSLLQRCSHASEFLFEHPWQPHQKHFNFTGRYLLGRQRCQFWESSPTENQKRADLGRFCFPRRHLVFSVAVQQQGEVLPGSPCLEAAGRVGVG